MFYQSVFDTNKTIKTFFSILITFLITFSLATFNTQAQQAYSDNFIKIKQEIDKLNSALDAKMAELKATQANTTQSTESNDGNNTNPSTKESCEKLQSMQSGTECYQDSSTGEWKIRSAVTEGDSCPISECFDKTNTETCKYVWVSDAFECVANTCKNGYKVVGHICQKEIPITCDETQGEIVAPSGDKCLKCTTGHIANKGKCEKCPHDKKPAGNKCIDFTCNASEWKHWGKCYKCSKNQIIIEKENKCVTCPEPKKAVNNECVDFSCPNDKFKKNGECLTKYPIKEFKKGCTRINGKLQGQKKCIFNPHEHHGTPCNDLAGNTDRIIYTGFEGDKGYCLIE